MTKNGRRPAERTAATDSGRGRNKSFAIPATSTSLHFVSYYFPGLAHSCSNEPRKMKIGTALLALLASAAHGAEGFGAPQTFGVQRTSTSQTALGMATKAKEKAAEKTDDDKVKEEDKPPVNIGWDSHKAVVRSPI